MVLIRSILDFLNKKNFLLMMSFFFLIGVMGLTGCMENQKKDSIVALDKTGENATSEYYRIYNGNTEEDRYFSYYEIYNKNGGTVKKECTYMVVPEILSLEENILKITVQGGTGASTKETYYYHIEQNIFSPKYQNVLTEMENLVAYFDGEKIIVCDMYYPSKFCKEFLQGKLSHAIDPIKQVEFSEELETITVVYYTQSGEIVEETLLIR